MAEPRSTTGRPADLQAFLDAVRAGFRSASMDADTGRCLDDVFALLDGGVGATGPAPRRFPACSWLPRAAEAARARTPELARIAETFQAVEPRLAWSQRNGGPHASANLAEGHANAMVVGPGGLETRADVWVGVSLLAPDVRYPDHRHDPEEIYLVLSPGAFRQAEGPWFEPGPGGTFFNEPGIVHAMRSGDRPLLAVWCLRPAPPA